VRFHPLAQITTWQIEKWKAEEGKRLNPVTVNRRLTVIKHMFKKAVEWDLLKTNPAISVERFSVTSERTRFLSHDEIKRLLAECEKQMTSPWLLPLVTLALNTGNAARRVVKAQVGKRGTGARIDHDDPRQDPEAKKDCD